MTFPVSDTTVRLKTGAGALDAGASDACAALIGQEGRSTTGPPGRQRVLYSFSRPRLMIVFWISEVPSPISRNGASRMSRSISYSLE
jgi:hypothetical protein